MNRWFQRNRVDRPANCREVIRVLQSYLDGEVDDLTARRIEEHLDDCRRCGLEATTYADIKNSLRHRRTVDREAVERLRAFGEQLATGDDGDDQGAQEARD